jgi:hypothetical protein
VIPPLSVYIDNNVWDFLYDRRIDLATTLSRDRFCLAITREAELEIPVIPDDEADLKDFITHTIAPCTILTDTLFGFFDEAFPEEQQRYGGLTPPASAGKKVVFLSGFDASDLSPEQYIQRSSANQD